MVVYNLSSAYSYGEIKVWFFVHAVTPRSRDQRIGPRRRWSAPRPVKYMAKLRYGTSPQIYEVFTSLKHMSPCTGV